MARRATQADVARLAQVSQTTVSMVLTGTGAAQRRVSGAVRERVLRAIEETGYAANPVAQRLAGGRTSIIGVYTYEAVFPVVAGDFYHPFLEGVEQAAEDAGVDLLMFTSLASKAGRGLTASGGVGRLRVADGCILVGRHSYPEDLADLLRRDFPFVFIGRRESAAGVVPYAGAGYAAATQEAVDQLIALGHRRIAALIESTEHESMRDRLEGYRTAVSRAGLEAISFEDPDPNSTELIDALEAAGITAAVAAPDLAAPLRRAALGRGWSIPGDLSIVRLGDPERPEQIDGIDWTGFLTPRREMGAEALRLLLRQLADSPESLTQDDLQLHLPCIPHQGATVAPPGRSTPARETRSATARKKAQRA